METSPKTKSRAKIWLDFLGGTVDKNPPANAGDTVRSLVWDDSTCCGTTKPEGHNYCVHALGPVSGNYWACAPQRVKPTRPRAHTLQLRSRRTATAEAQAPTASGCSATRDTPAVRSSCTTRKSSPCSPQLEKAHTESKWRPTAA